jgi:transposase-like protein
MMQAQADHRNTMLALAREWRKSAATARTFAQEHGVTPWMLYAWRKRLVNEQRPARRRRRSRRVPLAPLHVVTPAPESGGDLEIVLAHGDRVRVSSTMSVETLRRVVDVLRAAC